MEGPFSKEMNYCMLKDFDADVLVTEDSGNTGGIIEKFEAANMLGIPVILIKRPKIDYPNVVTSIDELYKEMRRDDEY